MDLPVVKGVVTLVHPPEGYDVNFENPKRNGDIACYWLTGVGSLLAILFLGQRLYVKTILRKQFRIDDVLLIIAWAFSIAIQALIVRAFVRKYIGVHVWEMPLAKFKENYTFAVYIHTIVYAPPTALTKLVLLLFYIQLHNQASWFRWATYTTMFINVGASTGIFFSSIFACSPIAMGWDFTITDGRCIDRPALYEATAAFGVIVDCLIITIPIPMVLGLQLSRSKKIGLILMFVLGSITVITSIVRLALLVTEIKQIDSTWVGGPINYWVSIEANLLIICASLPTIPQFVREVAPRLMSSAGNSKYFKQSDSGRNWHTTISSDSRKKRTKKRNPYGMDTDLMMETLVDTDGNGGHAQTSSSGANGESNTTIHNENAINKVQTAQVTSSPISHSNVEPEWQRAFA